MEKKSISNASKRKAERKLRETFEQQAGEIRKNISIAKAEIERLKTNRKISRQGKKNREKLVKACKVLSVAELFSYMEKEKSMLRKLKKGFQRRKKQERES